MEKIFEKAKDRAIERRWFLSEDEDLALLANLKGIAGSPSERTIFVRRLSWVPLNYPCQIDDGPAFRAEEILVATETDAQVLNGYWIARDQLVDYISRFEVVTADFETYGSGMPACTGGIAYFESTLFVWGEDIQPASSFGATGSEQRPRELMENGTAELTDARYGTGERDRYLIRDFTPDHGRVFLSERGLAAVEPLRLSTTESLAGSRGLSVRCEWLALKESVTHALRDGSIAAISDDAFRDGTLGNLSRVSTVDEVSKELEGRLSAEFGTFHFFDKEWNLRFAVSKLRGDAGWKLLTIGRPNA